MTGMLDVVAGWSPTAPITDADLAACQEVPLQTIPQTLPGPFDLVASTCLLSQLIFGIVRTAGAEHPRFIEAVQATRLGHLRLLAGLVCGLLRRRYCVEVVGDPVEVLSSGSLGTTARVLARIRAAAG